MPKPSLCWNAIVKNESGRIIRAAASVLPYIRSYSILDTGSTDGTTDLIRDFFTKYGIKGHIHFGEFKDFSQARNDAFIHARNDNGQDGAEWCQFALLMDADMELKVCDQNAFEPLFNGDAVSFSMMQRAGGVSYANCRVLNLSYPSHPYVGVTHEYICATSNERIMGAYFLDHADGANRPNKFVRDIALLEQGLRDEPGNGRYIYYLAQSYRDAGMLDKASEMYQKRIDMGGWEEETHSAMMNLAFCEKESRNFGGFLDAMVQAYNFRPTRVEPLYELAKAYRERGQNLAGLMFAKAGLKHQRPDDLLFINDFAYEHGMLYEYSIMAFYDPAERQRGYHATNKLALDLTCPETERQTARNNMAWYLPTLSHFCASFKTREIDFTCPDGFTAMNPSVCATPGGGLELILRTVNYKMDSEGRYMIGPKECHDAPIETENYLLTLDHGFETVDYHKIKWERPPAKFPLVIGLEDMRLFWHKGHRAFSATVREQSEFGNCEQWIGSLEKTPETHEDISRVIVHEAQRIVYGGNTEKNWMPIDKGRFMYDMRTAITHFGEQVSCAPRTIADENIRGSSQLIPFQNGYLAVVHEAVYCGGKRVYQHRFAKFDRGLLAYKLSLPFVFEEVQIEFCAGLAWHPNCVDLVISYGVRDEKAMVAKVSNQEVAMMFGDYP
jgi:glycosyltransferase involved in cell wall biosynthesis/DNA-binding transcriptional regulator/RsmH inhibitor MraZ